MNIEETRRKYRDIIDKERPVHTDDHFSSEHPKMDLLERAKIFAPFSALRGLNKALSARIKIDIPPNELTPEREEEIDSIIKTLKQGDMITVIIKHGSPDTQDNSSEVPCTFEKISGTVSKLRFEEGYIRIVNERIPLDSIYDIKLIR